MTNDRVSTLSPQTMDRRLGFLLLVAAGLLVLGLAPPTRADDQLDQVLDQDDGLDVEDELDLGLVDEEEEEGGDAPEEEAAKAAPPAPKVSGRSLERAGPCGKDLAGCVLTPPTPAVTFR